jgi:hypothetical protein
MTEQQDAAQKQGAVIGGWVCIALGTVLMFWTLLSFLLYLPLFFAAFVLGIVAIAQRRLGHGIPILLLSVVIPLVIGMALGAYRTQQLMEEAGKTEEARTAARSSESAPPSVAPEPSVVPSGPTQEQKYIEDHLELYDFQAKYMNAALDGRVPGVTFKIKNTGDRSVERVKVVVLFKDETGAVIAEEDYIPVLVSQYSVSSNNKPLKPGYIWQQERGRFFTAKSVPSEWKEGAAEVRIVEIRFEKDGT